MSGPPVGRVIPNAPPRLPKRKRLYHTPPPWVKSGEIFFVTICCVPRNVNQLAHHPVFAVVAGAMEHHGAAGNLWAQVVLAMPDHLHTLLAFPAGVRMEKILRDWKRFVAKRTGVKWQDGFFDHRLRGHESLEEKAHYIRMNPVRAGLATEPGQWPYVWPARVDVSAR